MGKKSKAKLAAAAAANASANLALTVEQRQQQTDNIALYSSDLLVWVKNPYKKKSRIGEDDVRLLQGLPPYDADAAYRAEHLSKRRSLRPVWVMARVVAVDNAEMTVKVATIQCFPEMEVIVPIGCEFPSTPYIVNDQSGDPSQSGVNNMVDMAQLHEASLLHNIEKRFQSNQIYTYAGDTLIAVNPYQLISLGAAAWVQIAEKCRLRLAMERSDPTKVDIYHASVQQVYIKCPSPAQLEEMPREKRAQYNLPPHVFQVAHETFHALSEVVGGVPRAQSVVISGESGAGKTATTKLILSYLTALSAQKGAGRAASSGKRDRRRTSVVANEFELKGLDSVSKQILESNVILEAFGNAKTLRNDNSSRFGKYIKLFFADASSVGGSTLSIVRASVTPYLLEKVRVILQNEGERNYHVFYMMHAGLSAKEKAAVGMRSIEDYKLLTQSTVRSVPGVDDHEEFTHMRAAFQSAFRIPAKEESELYQLMVGVLSLGNLEFDSTHSDRSVISDASRIDLDAVSTAFGIDVDALNHALCYIELVDHEGNVIMRELPPEKALGSALSCAKMVYERVFKWMVTHINGVMNATSESLFGNVVIEDTSYIGILDIFGFEVFEINSFEQLCINFANEKLQAFYVRHVFDLERVLYEKEGIDFDDFTYTDNKKIMQLLEKPRKPPGIFCMLDEAVLFPKSTDVSLFNSIVKQHKKHPHFGTIKSVGKKAGQSRDSITAARARAQLSFTVSHSATDVAYYIDGFLEKNKDRLPPNLDRLIENSAIPLLAKVCQVAAGMVPKSKKAKKTGSFAGTTLGAKFVGDIARLMKSLEATNPHFVRCIKPNNCKSPLPISPTLVHHQLCYLGVLNAIKLRHSGFSFRQEYDLFYERFIIVCAGVLPWPPPRGSNATDLVKQMMVHLNGLLRGRQKLGKDDFQYGRTKIFFRNHAIVRLEALREEHLRKMDLAATKLQRWWCTMAGANLFHRMRLSMMRFQAAFRGCGVRESYLHRTRAVGVLQKLAQRRAQKRKFANAVSAIMMMQNHFRAIRQRRLMAKRRRGIAALRAAARGLVVREQMLRLNAAINTLQRTVRKWRAEYALYWAKVKCALLVQAASRGLLMRKNRRDIMEALALRARARKFGAAVSIIEQLYKTKLIRARFEAVRAATLTLQSFCHVVADRNRWLRKRRAMALLQRVARGAAARDIVGGMVRANIIADEMFRLKSVRKREARMMKVQHEFMAIESARIAQNAAASGSGAYAAGGGDANATVAARDAMYAAPSSTVIAASAASRKLRRGLLYKLIDVDVVEALAVGETEIYDGGWSHIAGQLESQLMRQGHHSVMFVCGAAHSASLAADGTLRTWGWGDRGQLGHGDLSNLGTPQVVRFFLRSPTLAVRHVACGEDHTAVLTRLQQVYTWGDGRRGQLGLGPDALFVHTPSRVGVPDAVQISCGGHHTMALVEDGSVWTWGSGAQIGHGVFSGCGDSSLPRALDALTHLRVRHIECGLAFSAAVTHTGALYTWGDNKQGQLGQGDRLSRYAPRRVDRFPETVATTSCGSRHMAALTSSGQLFIWGWGAHGQLGLGSDLSDKTSPVLLSQHTLIDGWDHHSMVQVACGWRHTAAVTDEHNLFVWGAVATTTRNPDIIEPETLLCKFLVPSLIGRDQLPGVPVMIGANSSHSMSIIGVQYFPTVELQAANTQLPSAQTGRSSGRGAARDNDAQLLARMQEKGMTLETFNALRQQREEQEGGPAQHVPGYRDVEARQTRKSPNAPAAAPYNTKRGSFWTTSNPEAKAVFRGGGRGTGTRLAMTASPATTYGMRGMTSSKRSSSAPSTKLTTSQLLGLDEMQVGTMSREELLAAVQQLRQRKSKRDGGGNNRRPAAVAPVSSGAPIMPRGGRSPSRAERRVVASARRDGGVSSGRASSRSPPRTSPQLSQSQSQAQSRSPPLPGQRSQRRDLYGRTFSVISQSTSGLLEHTGALRSGDRGTPNRYRSPVVQLVSPSSTVGLTEAERLRKDEAEFRARNARSEEQRQDELRQWRMREGVLTSTDDANGLFAPERLVSNSDGAADRDLLRRRQDAGHERERFSGFEGEGGQPQPQSSARNVRVNRAGSVFIGGAQR